EPAEEISDVTEAAETVEEIAATEEIVEEVTEETKEKSDKGILGIVIGAALMIAMLVLVWMSPVGNSHAVKDSGVFYAKDNGLYFYDMKNEPYLVQEGISDGGGYNYFYSAWGAGVAEEGDWAYYSVNIKEDGSSDLYCKNVKEPSAEAVLVDSEVYDYTVSKDGNVVAYLKMQGESLHLCTFDGGSITTYAKGIHLEDDVYKLSADGRYLVFKDAYDMLCAAEVTTGGGEVDVAVLTDSCPLYELSEDGTLYFVSKADGIFNIYSYDFENEPELVAENAQYMELMPNGSDLLYGVKPTEKIPYSALLEDDMAEIDAAMKEDDPNYEQKLMRDELRAAMESGEGLEPLMQQYYILSNGKSTLVADNVVSAIAVQGNDKNFVTGYQAKEFQPLYLSVIGGGLEMVDMIYYMSINYGGMHPFLADGTGNVEVLTGSGVLLNTLKVSFDGSKAAYLVEDPNTGGNILMQMEIGKAADAAVVQTDVEDFGFIGGNGPLVYYYEYARNAGTLASVESDRTIKGVTGVTFAKDVKEVFYIKDIDGSTGVGQMQHWDGKDEPTIVDGGVFAFQYKGNGKAAVIYDYDILKQVGGLGYYDGEGMTMLDEDVTAIFIN
ncbi:MAG: hypothetical protein IIV62_06005, partial [Anaerotignum sp.]|nr:hypothetical protein [Anaerotignum sp.]